MHSQCLFLLFASVAIISGAKISNAAPEQREAIGSYHVDRIPRTWQSAVDLCRSMNMKLVDISSSDKDLELMTLLEASGLSDTALWSSGKKVGSSFVWTEQNNAPFGYTRWYPGEPNDSTSAEVCMHFKSKWGWYDITCDDNASLAFCQPAAK